MTGRDVEARLRRAADGLPELPDRLDEVRRRGRRRRTAARAGAVVTAAAAVALGAVIVVPSGDRPPAPIVEEPGPEPTATTSPSPSQDASPRSSSTASPTASPTDELATVAPAELPWAVVTSTPDGVHLWEDGEGELLATEQGGGPPWLLAWLPETGAIGQGTAGAPIVRLGPGAGDGDQLVAEREDLLLRAAGTGPDGREVLLVTWSRPAAELGPEIVLGLVDVVTREVEELGVVGNREDGPDGMAIDAEGIVWATCHLQCTLATLPLSEDGDERREIAPADWRAGVALAGDTVATVAFTFDPEEGRPSAARLVLHHRGTGDVLREVPLARTRSWQVDLSLSADGAAALVTLGGEGDTQVYVVDGLSDSPRVRLLHGTGRAVFADQ